MPYHRRPPKGWPAALALAAGVVLLGIASPADEPADAFRPVAPAPAIHAALQSNLKIVQGWLNDRDYQSAAQSAQALVALTQLYGHQSTDPAWRGKAAALRGACAKLASAAGARDAAGCRKGVQECEALLAELAKSPPRGPKAPDPDFRPAGSTRHWMVVLDGAYADAKAAETARELEHLAYTLAEGANATRFLRADPRWRQLSDDARESALRAADKAHAGELEPARQALKVVYQRCEACHQGYKK